MATHSSILAWRILWTEEPGGLHTVHGVVESDTTERLSHFHFSFASPLWLHIPSSSCTISTSLWQYFPTIQPWRLTLCLPVCHSASLPQPISFHISLLLPESRAGYGWKGWRKGKSGEDDSWQREPSLLPPRRNVGAWGKDATVQISTLQWCREEGTQGLCYALFLLILGLPSAAIRMSSARGCPGRIW